jgi:hypothetical protein
MKTSTVVVVETWACPVSHCSSVGLSRFTPLQCGLALSHPTAVWTPVQL